LLTTGQEILPILLNSVCYHVDDSFSLARTLSQLRAVRSLVSHLFYDHCLSYPWDPKVVSSIFSEQYFVGISQLSIFFLSFINFPRLVTSEIQHHKYYNRNRFTASALLFTASLFKWKFCIRAISYKNVDTGTRNYPDDFKQPVIDTRQ
jgi:hypothetical protein